MTDSAKGGKTVFSTFHRCAWLITIVALCLVMPVLAQTHGFVPIDAPGAGTLQNQGTIASVINRSGVVAGYYDDDKYAYHGFCVQRKA